MAKKKKTGRPTGFREEMCAIIEKDLADGHSIRAASSTLGVTHDTVYRWMKQFPIFADAIKKGLAKGLKKDERLLNDTIHGKAKMSKEATTLLIFKLKTRFHDVYGDSTLDVDDQNIQVNVKFNKKIDEHQS